MGKGNQKRGGDGGKRLKEIEGDPFFVDIGQIVKIFCLFLAARSRDPVATGRRGGSEGRMVVMSD